jgi:phospholipase/carboxylesterase
MQIQSISIPATSKNAPTGLIILLHGWGANANDLESLAQMLDLTDYRFEFPDEPFPHPMVSWGKMWYDLESAEYKGLAESRQLLVEWLSSLEDETGIPLERTILGGFSQGGAMSLDVGLTLPVAGIVSMSGFLHSKPQPSVESLPPVLMVHGRQDPVVPLEAAKRSLDSLTAAGVDVRYQEFDMGHEIRLEVLDAVRSFIQETMSKFR